MKKRLLSSALAILLVVSSMCSGSGTTVLAENNEPSKNNEASEFPMDPSVMKPWINSTILGMVTKDVEADIKDDYFLNVNHDWFMNVKLRPGYSNETPLFDAMENVQNRCIDILNDKSLEGEDAERIQNYYELWLDWDERNETGVKPLLPLAKKIQEISSLNEMSEFMVSNENFLWGKSLAEVGLGINAQDSSRFDVQILPTDLSLDDAAEYKTLTENGKRMKEAIESRYTYMLSRIGLSDDEIQKTMEDFWEFEKLISGYEKSTLEQNDPEYVTASVNSVSMDDIKKLSPNYPLAEYMVNNGWSKSQLINLREPEWLTGLNEIYTEENLDKIKAYVLASSMGSFIQNVDEEAYRENQAIGRKQSGATDDTPDDILAYRNTRKCFPNSFARIYVEKYLNEDIRKEITKLCQDSIDYYDKMLEETEWLSPKTRKEAQNKLRNMKICAVYPDKWEDESLYKVTSKKDGGTYIQALIDYRKAEHQIDIERINTRLDPDIWVVDILETNAFYAPSLNSIFIIPGYFCDVTYSENMSIEEKYGALGSIIGHEISHAFDPVGAQFDAEGNVDNWWTDEDYAAFQERADKVINYYDQVVAFDDGTKYSGQMVQTEAIADMAGLKCMLKMAENIEGFDYDKFFRANAKLWARAGTVEFMERCTTTDVHPLHYLRVNVAVSQFDEFVDCYGVKEGDGMYVAPKDRISVW